MTKFKLFLKLGNFDGNTTRLVKVDEFVDEYAELKFGNGCDWARDSAVKKYKFCRVKANYKISFSWEPSDEEKKRITSEIKSESVDTVKYKGNTVYMLKVYGIQDCENRSNNIRQDIKNIILKKRSCVVCGSNTDIEVDHKNCLYNDPRVLNTKTQVLDDFQLLCRHCNLQKRQIHKKQSETGIRYPATKIPSLKVLGIDYTQGGPEFDPKDINAMVGTYWYDPVKFIEESIRISLGL